MKKIIGLIKIVLSLSAISGVIAFIADRFGNSNSAHKPFGIYEEYIKRPLDCFLATGALIVLSPLLIIVALLVRFNLGAPVIFTQERPGKDEKIFRLYKFRTMTDERDENGVLLQDAVRLTSFGKWLRSTSLDELPELINIVKGDMAIIGPRPLLVRYLDRYNEEQKHRHDVRPGLTSLSASKKRNLATWSEKFADDVDYANNITFLADVRILIDTVRIVVNGKGISSESSETMEEFKGN